jgi:hypothetical protein
MPAWWPGDACVLRASVVRATRCGARGYLVECRFARPVSDAELAAARARVEALTAHG